MNTIKINKENVKPRSLPGEKFILFIAVIAGLCSANIANAQWQQMGLVGKSVYSIAFVGTNIFVGVTNNEGVFLSTDNGSTWTAVNTGLTNKTILSLAASGTTIFAGTWGGGVCLSTNNGSSWSAVNTGLPANTKVKSLAISPNGAGGTNIFAGTLGGGIFLSTNNGSSWTAVNTGLTSVNIQSFAINGADVFAGSYMGAFLSTNNGGLWTDVSTGLVSTYVQALAIRGTTIFAGTDNGAFISSNNGTLWTAVNTGLTNKDVLALIISGGNIFAGTNGAGVALSGNNGTIWTDETTGMPPNSYVYSFGIIGTTIFAGTGEGVWKRPVTDFPLGVAAVSDNADFTVYPNPTNGKFTIKNNELHDMSYELVIYNVLGEKVNTSTVGGRQDGLFDLSSQPNGVYHLNISAISGSATGEKIDKTSFSQKIVIQK